MPYLLPWLRVNLLIRSITERVWHEEVALFRALAALAPAGMLLSGSAVLFFRRKTVCTSLQLLGAGCLMVVLPPLYRAALRLVGGRPTLIPSASARPLLPTWGGSAASETTASSSRPR